MGDQERSEIIDSLAIDGRCLRQALAITDAELQSIARQLTDLSFRISERADSSIRSTDFHLPAYSIPEELQKYIDCSRLTVFLECQSNTYDLYRETITSLRRAQADVDHA